MLEHIFYLIGIIYMVLHFYLIFKLYFLVKLIHQAVEYQLKGFLSRVDAALNLINAVKEILEKIKALLFNVSITSKR